MVCLFADSLFGNSIARFFVGWLSSLLAGLLVECSIGFLFVQLSGWCAPRLF
jgi:hypothetical protein